MDIIESKRKISRYTHQCSCGCYPDLVKYTKQDELDYIKLICPNGCHESKGVCSVIGDLDAATKTVFDDWNTNPIVRIKMTKEQLEVFQSKGGKSWLLSKL